jgi:hypothetical protein
MALLQRLTLHRVVHSAALLDETSTGAGDGFARLRAMMLDFAVRGNFTQISVREAVHRYYQAARTGLDVASAWNEAHRAIAERDAQNTAARQERLAAGQRRLATQMTESLAHIARVQRFVHVLEYAIFSVYFAHLWHMFAADNKALNEWLDEKMEPGAGDWTVSFGVFVAAAIGGGLAALINRWVDRSDPPDKKE